MASEKEYIERGALVEHIKNMPWKITPAAEISKGIFLQTVEDAPAADVVSKGVYDQVQWERDMAMQQLEEHGIPFCGKADDVVKVVRCKDCKHWCGEEEDSLLSIQWGVCTRPLGSYRSEETQEKDYCSYSERKDTP